MYVYTVTEQTTLQSPFKPARILAIRRKSDDRLLASLHPDGRIVVEAGYSWDGATPKYKLFCFILGIWDGEWQHSTGRPQLWEATLKHDIMIQLMSLQGYGAYVTWTYKDNDREFRRMMVAAKFKYARLYYVAVRAYDKISISRNRNFLQ